MREIQFRAKPVYRGDKQTPWVYGTFKYIWQNSVTPGASDNGRHEQRKDKGVIIGEHNDETEVLYDTVGQFTGLKDKKDKEIYEGDIMYSEFSDGSSGYSLIGWNEREASFGMMDAYSYQSKQEGYDFPEFKNYVLIAHLQKALICEVVGNIYDNQELLKKD